jgi:hypothetical protein
MDFQMSWTEATRPASRMKDCGGKRRTVNLGEKASDVGDVKKASVWTPGRQGTAAQ